ncbi:tRNA methyltransferase 10 homolog B-like [Amphiura filiformis]|uniref:tRNA methyltransferase 10 homolog B-like n=1 Tax=Amphiura filiformis TaxID=82378 RepID=UPI003B20E57A
MATSKTEEQKETNQSDSVKQEDDQDLPEESLKTSWNEASQNPNDLPMSRKAKRKLEHFERVREAHKLKRRQRKEERRKVKELHQEQGEHSGVASAANCSNRPTKKELNQQIKKRMQEAMDGPGPRICIDLSMAHTMNTKEIHKLAGQIGRLYGSNRKAEKPLHLWLSSLDTSGQIYDSCVKRNDGFDNYLIDKSDKTHTEIFKTEDIVYLTPDSTNVLEQLESDKVYIIGGLVDETPNKFYTLTNAKDHGLQTARMPIDEYMKKTPSGTYNKILTVNQVFDILLTLHNTGDWKQALSAGVPPRIGYVLR